MIDDLVYPLLNFILVLVGLFVCLRDVAAPLVLFVFLYLNMMCL